MLKPIQGDRFWIPLLTILGLFWTGFVWAQPQPMERMVLIEANIWEINESANFDYGVVWDLIDLDPEVNDLLESSIFLPGLNPSTSPAGAFITGQANIFRDRGAMEDVRVAQVDLTLQASVRDGSVHLRANPKITVVNGSTGVIHSGERVPVVELRTPKLQAELHTVFKDTGVKLAVEPHILEAYPDFILLSLRPQVEDITAFVERDTSEGTFTLPIFSTRMVQSQVVVRSGGTIILSGLLSEQKIENVRAVPLVSKIPVLGWLFRSKNVSRTKSDILIEITATILPPGESRFLPNGFIYEGEIFKSDSDVATEIREAELEDTTEDPGFNPEEWFEMEPAESGNSVEAPLE